MPHALLKDGHEGAHAVQLRLRLPDLGDAALEERQLGQAARSVAGLDLRGRFRASPREVAWAVVEPRILKAAPSFIEKKTCASRGRLPHRVSSFR